MRFVVAVAAVLMVGLPVKAWDTAPLCAFEPPPPLSLPEIAEPETAPMCVLPEPSPAQDLSAETVRESWEAIRLGDEDPEAALLRMSILEEALPRLTDVFLVRRGELLLSMGDARAARQAFANALETPSDSEIGLRARVGRVRALLAMGHRDAVNDLTALLRRYPDLPEEPQLEFDLARMREEAGAQSDAIRTYRRLDIRSPGTDVARQARERLNVLRAEGVEVRALTLAERVARTEKLVARGPLADARVELAELMEEARLGPTHRAKVYFLAARIARHEGRWDDARQLLQRGQGTGAVVGDEDDQARRQQRAENLAQA
ncbi:MAG: tetratricopeptide repeat protein, partial [Myxococcota bacterium]